MPGDKSEEYKTITERPMLFSGELVRAILDGTKTQTRRPVKYEYGHGGHPRHPFAPHAAEKDNFVTHSGPYSSIKKELIWFYGWGNCRWLKSPFGQPGGRIWVKEKHYVTELIGQGAGNMFLSYQDEFETDDPESSEHRPWRHDLTPRVKFGPRPSVHMPRWASRINLEITGVRVERLQDASKGDLVHEGWPDADEVATACKTMHEYIDDSVVEWFADAWDAIYAKQGLGWDANPWVWVVEFRRAEA